MMSRPFTETFIIECHDLLAEVDQAALSLESEGPSEEKINQIFRAFHTIKGSAGICGLTPIVNFTHHVENLLDLVREGKIPVSSQLIDLVLRSEDQVEFLVSGLEGGDGPDPATTARLVADLCTHAGLKVSDHVSHTTKKLTEEESAFLF